MNKEELIILIEEQISVLGLDPISCRGDKPGMWSLKIKDSSIWIDVFNFESKPEIYYFQVMSPLFKVTDILNTEIMIDLLEYAYSMYNSSVCKKEQWYYALHLREAEGLSKTEISSAINKVAFYSSDIYAKFSFKYAAAFPIL